jgi:hypothetical protein
MIRGKRIKKIPNPEEVDGKLRKIIKGQNDFQLTTGNRFAKQRG